MAKLENVYTFAYIYVQVTDSYEREAENKKNRGSAQTGYMKWRL